MRASYQLRTRHASGRSAVSQEPVAISYQRSAISNQLSTSLFPSLEGLGVGRKLKAALSKKLRAVFSHPSPRRSFSEGGFTLIEILVVLAIILVLASIVISTGKYAQTKAARSRTQAEMAAMETALESYSNDNGTFPLGDNTDTSATNIYNALAGGDKVYMSFKPGQIVALATTPVSTNIIDSFGRPYYYQSPGVSNVAGFDLWSAGPDAQPNTLDDIVNWRQQ